MLTVEVFCRMQSYFLELSSVCHNQHLENEPVVVLSANNASLHSLKTLISVKTRHLDKVDVVDHVEWKYLNWEYVIVRGL